MEEQLIKLHKASGLNYIQCAILLKTRHSCFTIVQILRQNGNNFDKTLQVLQL